MIYFFNKRIKRNQHLAHRRICPHHSRRAGLQSRPNSPPVEARPQWVSRRLLYPRRLQLSTIRPSLTCSCSTGFEGTLSSKDLKPPHRQTGKALWVTPENKTLTHSCWVTHYSQNCVQRWKSPPFLATLLDYPKFTRNPVITLILILNARRLTEPRQLLSHIIYKRPWSTHGHVITNWPAQREAAAYILELHWL